MTNFSQYDDNIFDDSFVISKYDESFNSEYLLHNNNDENFEHNLKTNNFYGNLNIIPFGPTDSNVNNNNKEKEQTEPDNNIGNNEIKERVVPNKNKIRFMTNINNKVVKKKKDKKRGFLRPDNNIQKFNRYFVESLRIFLNNKNKKIMKKNGKDSLFLKKIKYEFYKDAKIDSNLAFLNLTIKELFSKPVSKKYTNNNEYYNKNNIDNFLNNFKEFENGKELYNILNKTVDDLRKNYVNGDYKEEGFSFEKDLCTIENKVVKELGNETNGYIKNLREFGINFREKLEKMKKTMNQKIEKK